MSPTIFFFFLHLISITYGNVDNPRSCLSAGDTNRLDHIDYPTPMQLNPLIRNEPYNPEMVLKWDTQSSPGESQVCSKCTEPFLPNAKWRCNQGSVQGTFVNGGKIRAFTELVLTTEMIRKGCQEVSVQFKHFKNGQLVACEEFDSEFSEKHTL